MLKRNKNKFLAVLLTLCMLMSLTGPTAFALDISKTATGTTIQDQENQDQEGQDQENQDQEGQDQEGQGQENQDQEGQDQENQDQEGQDQENQDQEGQDQENQGQENKDQENQDQDQDQDIQSRYTEKDPAVETVIRLISELPEEISLEDADEIVAARSAYEALDEEQKAAIESSLLEKLFAAEETLRASDVLDSVADLAAAIAGAEGPITIELTNGFEFEANTDGAKAAIIIDAGQDVTLTASEPVILSRSKNSIGMFLIENGGKLCLTGELQLSGGGNETGNGTTPIVCMGELTISGNAVISGFKALYGGALRIQDGGRGTMEGGRIEGNRANAGGGVLIGGNSLFTMDDGQISDNESMNEGGGIFIGKSINKWDSLISDMVPQGNVQLNGGVISGNKASTGGGIYVEGSLYVGISYLTMRNVTITGNSADTTSFPFNCSGGGVWFCQVGKGSVYATSGGAMYGNSADDNGSDFYSVWKGSDPVEGEIHLPTRLPNGQGVGWYKDYEDMRYTQESDPIDDFTGWVQEYFDHYNLALHCEAPGYQSSLLITDNHATEGGGIACNGYLQIGDDRDMTLNVTKKWENDTPGDRPGEIKVMVQKGGEDLEEVTLNEKNEWTATLVDLPEDTYTVAELSQVEGYKTVYGAPAYSDGGRTVSFTITNQREVAVQPTPEPDPGPAPDPDPTPDTRPDPKPEVVPEQELPDEPTPLAPHPSLPVNETDIGEEDVPLEDLPEIPEEEVPLGDLPQTGAAAVTVNPAALGLLALALSMAAAGMGVTVTRKKHGAE